jgi:hypothetical protein
MRMRHIAICDLSDSTILFHINKRQDFRGKNFTGHKMCFDFRYKFGPKNFSLQEKLCEIFSKMKISLYIKYPLFLSDFNKIWIFPGDFSENRPTEISNFMQNHPLGADMFHSDRQTNKSDESNSRSSRFFNRSKNKHRRRAFMKSAGFKPYFASNEATSHLRLRPHGNRDRRHPPIRLPGRYNPSRFHTNFIETLELTQDKPNAECEWFYKSNSPELWSAFLQPETQLINPGKGCKINEPSCIYT